MCLLQAKDKGTRSRSTTKRRRQRATMGEYAGIHTTLRLCMYVLLSLFRLNFHIQMATTIWLMRSSYRKRRRVSVQCSWIRHSLRASATSTEQVRNTVIVFWCTAFVKSMLQSWMLQKLQRYYSLWGSIRTCQRILYLVKPSSFYGNRYSLSSKFLCCIKLKITPCNFRPHESQLYKYLIILIVGS